jgi:hypothetical protein
MMASFLWCTELDAEAGQGLESLDRNTHSTRMVDPVQLLSLAFGSANNKLMTANCRPTYVPPGQSTREGGVSKSTALLHRATGDQGDLL